MTPCSIVDKFIHFGGMTSAALKRVAVDCPENFI
jgi:hypothetical protein